VSADASTTEVRRGMEVDAGALADWMQAQVPGFAGPLQLRQFKGGQSNPTYLVTTPGERYVLRRKPPGQLLASAHAVDREYRVTRALHEHTRVPVAPPLALCTDDAVIGSWFYVSAFVDGRVFWDPSFPGLSREERASCFASMNETIASLHCVDPVAIGLGDYGKPADYISRQLARWTKQYHSDVEAGRVAQLDRLIDWLAANVPAGDEAALVHGDYRCDNLMFHPVEPRIIAVLDWELSTLGHPLADFAYHLLMYRMPSLVVRSLAGSDLAAQGIPDEAAYVAQYCARTGREGIPDLDYYVAFCAFRLAGILHGIRGRVIRGTAASAQAREYAAHVEAVAEFGWQQAMRGAA
jgi:aminoglycoside phosphotransferase (APT) family kinase protein